MKKIGILLVGILLISITAGCIGGKTSTSTPTSTSMTQPTSTTSTISSTTTSTSSSSSTTTTSPPPKKYTQKELLQRTRTIKYFTFTDNTTMSIQLKLEVNNTVVQRQNITFEIKRKAYVDLENKIAEVNGTTHVYPNGGSSISHQVVVGDTIYIATNGITREIDNATIANLTWNYNPVSFAVLYLTEKPNRTEFINGTQFLYYPISTEDLKNMMAMFSPLKGTNVSVWNGILELRFKNGRLISERTMYEFKLTMMLNGNKVIEVGKVYDEIHIFDFNIKKNVKVPEKNVKA